jgi:hypothetical protein
MWEPWEPPTLAFDRFARFVLISIVALFVLMSARPAHSADVVYQHGHLADVPAILDEDGLTLRSSNYAFLAIHLDTVPESPAAIDYTQTISYLNNGRYELPAGGTIARSVSTTQADADGWILLPLSKPCLPGQDFTIAGLVTVCPPRDYVTGTIVHACAIPANGVAPIFYGFPAENVRCGTKRRSAGR